MSKAWVNIFKIPKKLRELPVLWAITTNESSYGRVLVSILDSKAFPQKICVVIGDRWYDFPLKVESIIPGVESYVETSDDLDEDEREGNSGDSDAFRENDSGINKRPKSGQQPSDGNTNKEAINMDTTSNSNDQPQQVDATSLGKYRAMAEGTVDLVTGQHFEEMANKVIMEEDEVVPIHQLNKQSLGDVNGPHVVSVTLVKVSQSAPEFGQAHVEGQNCTSDRRPAHIAISAFEPTAPRVMLADKEVSIPEDVWVGSKLSAAVENFMPRKSIVDCPGQQVTIALLSNNYCTNLFLHNMMLCSG
ncbi:hypothetical protein HU200_008029 [Digitaria exilis]|uniref:DUF4283 domain-containing protein n=1 Tax=Digitaria exilis TaxID=1010633 RepID=A0A835KTZ7_9POAL|nr:hypothetical protein HU200_021346 [Digitaria exilis]KAF8765917.1 hypothetical protein HU200_008029 [Digitaria exilis]